MAWLSGYSCRKPVPITGSAGAGTDYPRPLEVHSGKWASPTGFVDPDSVWAAETNIYDGNTATWGQCNTYNNYVELTFSTPINADTCRINIAEYRTPIGFFDPDIDIDFYYDAGWHNIWSGSVTKQTWIEKVNSAGVKTVEKVRVKFNDDHLGYFYEFDLEGSDSAGVVYLLNYCTDFPNDIRFTDDDGSTELDHFIEHPSEDPATFWIEVADNLDDNQSIYIYFGKSGASSDSNGANTFEEFLDKDSTAGWAETNIAVSTSGDFLRFYNPNNPAGYATRFDWATPTTFRMEARLKNESLGAADMLTMCASDGSTSHRLTMSQVREAKLYYYVHPTLTEIGTDEWTEATEHILIHQVDEGDSSTGIGYYLLDTSRTLLASATGKAFAYGSPTDCDGIMIGDNGTNWNCDIYTRWLFIRKWIATEPVVGTPGSLERRQLWASYQQINPLGFNIYSAGRAR